jgi:hypothetical protein
MTARSPVAAWRFRAETLEERSLTMPTAMNQVMSVATKPTPTPTAIGRRFAWFAPTMLAVRAERTRMHSSPSRNTRTAISKVAEAVLVLGAVGSGLPEAVTPCQTMIAATAKREIVNTTGHPSHDWRAFCTGGTNIPGDGVDMLLTFKPMTSRLYLTKTQKNLWIGS